MVDRASAVFTELIAEQKAGGAAAGDHFATPGANDRVWGALDKLALRAPDVFADYYANDVIALVCEAWLGPGYQVTSQVNVVNPGGQAQVAHRDYHLGFMSLDQSTAYPAHVHRLSPALTLQGAVAHCDMPVETGPTMYLPHSQKYEAGYVAFHRRSSPTTSTGTTSSCRSPRATRRSSTRPCSTARAPTAPPTYAGWPTCCRCFRVRPRDGERRPGRDEPRRCTRCSRRKATGASERGLRNVVAASAEGYAFPTNLDRDQPVGGLAPQTQAELVWQALEEGWGTATFGAALRAHTERRGTAQG